MIRINLLPPAARRRRRRQPGRERSALALMSLGWGALVFAGYLWIAATEADIAALRGQTAAVASEREAVRRSFDPQALVAREQALQAEREALVQLQAGRRTPAALLAELAALVAATGSGAGGSPFVGAEPGASLWLTELREQDRGRWSLTASAADLAALTDFVRRLGASERFAAVGPTEYVRGADGRLELRVELTARE